MTEQLQKKTDRAIRFLRSIPVKNGEKIELAYSGGKDSDVILQLAKEAGIPFWAIYKNTTIDPPGTISHVKKMLHIGGGTEPIGEIRQPKETFFHLIERAGLPNRFSRFCCAYLKEYKILDKTIIGVRKYESTKRNKRYNEPTECRFYGSRKEHVQAFYPILEWTDDDVRQFIKDRGITCAPVYYDKDGTFHHERRLGCMCCPLASEKKRIAQFKEYPKMLRQYARHLDRFWDSHKDCKQSIYFNNIYEQLTRNIFFINQAKFYEFRDGMFGKTDCKKFLEDYFNVKL